MATSTTWTRPDAWAEQAALTETDVLEEALLLLAGKRSDSRPDQADFV